MATASATPNTSTTRNAGDGNDLLDLRDPEASEQDSTQAEHSSGSDPAPTANEPTQGTGGDGLSEALKAERRRSNNLEGPAVMVSARPSRPSVAAATSWKKNCAGCASS